MASFFVRAGVAKRRERSKKQRDEEAKKSLMERGASIRSVMRSSATSVWEGEEPFKAGPEQGWKVHVPSPEVDNYNQEILTAINKEEVTKWAVICPPQERFNEMFLRGIFTCLRHQLRPSPEDIIPMENLIGDPDDDDNIPIAVFQRAFERLFFVLGNETFEATEYDNNGNGCVGWGEFSLVFEKKFFGIKWNIFERIYRTLDDPESSMLSQFVSVFVLLTICVSSGVFILSTVPALKGQISVFEGIEEACLIIFTIEYALRLLTVGMVRKEVLDKKKLLELTVGYETIILYSPPWRIFYFIIGFANLIDLAAILPGVIGWFVELDGGGFVVLRLIRLTRIFRAFKNPKLQEPVIVIAQTLVDSTKALYVLGFNLTLGIVIFGSLMYLAEKPDDGSESQPGFTSIPATLWVGIVTSTTVGYGDHFPVTTLGYLVVSGLMMFSLVILALPIGVIGGNFDNVWKNLREAQDAIRIEKEKDKKFLVSAIQDVNPYQMIKLMLIEVWNHRIPGLQVDKRREGVDFKPHGSEFLGQASVKIDLGRWPYNQPFASEPIECMLEPNPKHVKRECHGSITIMYEWFPASPTDATDPHGLGLSEEPVSWEESGKQNIDIRGQLRVILIGAQNLVNVSYHKNPPGQSNPYCVVYLYPKSPENRTEKIRPSIWRSPTMKNSLHPQWEAAHVWNYVWRNIPEDDPTKEKIKPIQIPKNLTHIIASLNPEMQAEILQRLRDMYNKEMVAINKEAAMLCAQVDGDACRVEIPSTFCAERPATELESKTTAVTRPHSEMASSSGPSATPASSAAPSPEPLEPSRFALLEGLCQPPGGASE